MFGRNDDAGGRTLRRPFPTGPGGAKAGPSPAIHDLLLQNYAVHDSSVPLGGPKMDFVYRLRC